VREAQSNDDHPAAGLLPESDTRARLGAEEHRIEVGDPLAPGIPFARTVASVRDVWLTANATP
jgi:hypothetical protein